MENCKLCKFETDTKLKLSKHIYREHGLRKGEYLIQTQYQNIQPTCKCGCGALMEYNPVLGDFPSYIKKHLHIIQKNMTQEEIFGDMNSPKRVKAISEARKQRFESGEYEHVVKAIKKGRKDPKLGAKISKGAKGVPKPKPEGFGVGRKHSKATKLKMSNTQKKKWESGDIGNRKYYTSNLEKAFSKILDSLNIKYKSNFYAKEIKAFYDFRLPLTNLIIEVDGDFWHCNPDSKFNTPKYKSQIKNLERDKEKNKWAKDNGYKLLRFWENDINNNIEKIKQILLKECEL